MPTDDVDIETIRVILPQTPVVRITSIKVFNLPGNAVQKQTSYPTPETQNDTIACLQAAGLCACILFAFAFTASGTPTPTPTAPEQFGNIPRTLLLPANQSVRRNSSNTAFEAYTASAGVTTFIGLSDVPNSYSGAGLKGVRVNAGATGLEFFTTPTATPTATSTATSTNTPTATATATSTPSATALQTFRTFSVSGQSDIVADQVDDTFTAVAGNRIIITTDASTDAMTFAWASPTNTPTSTPTATSTSTATSTPTATATATATPLSIFKTISIPGQSDVVADSDSDTLNINTVGNISATTNASTDTITLTVPTPTATATFTPTATATATNTATPTATATPTPTPELSTIGTPTYWTVQHFFNAAISTGSWSGGTITASGTANAVDVSAGTGFIKATDSNVATQSFFNWSASTALSVPSNTVRYIGVQYNAGTPNVVAKTSDSWDYDTEFPLGICVNEGGTRYIVNNTWNTGDNQTNLIERFDSLANIARDNRLGGLILGTTGTRNVTVSAGSLMDRMSEFAITAIDTSGSGTFDAYYRDGSGGWTKQAAQTQYDVSKYDNGTGTLANLTVLDYSSRWFYLMTDGSLAMVYGQNQFVSLALGLGDTVPSTVPPRIQAMGMLIGRLVIQQGVNAPAATQTVFTTTFSSNVVQNHNDLANIQGGTAGEYYHLTSSEYTGTGTGVFARKTSPAFVTPDLGTPSALVATNATGTAPSLTAGNATKWTTGRTVSTTGDVTYTSGSLDGSGNVTGAATVANVPAAATHGTDLTAVPTDTGGWNAYVVTGSNYTNATNGFTDIVVSGTLSNSTLYEFEFVGQGQCSGSGGLAFAFHGAGTGTAMTGTVAGQFGATPMGTTGPDGSWGTVGTGTTKNATFAHGFATTTSTGTATLSIQGKSITNTQTTTVFIGSVLRVRRAN